MTKSTAAATRPPPKSQASRPTEDYAHYHKDGSLWAKGQLHEGKPAGYWEWFRKDGTKMRSGWFEGGEQIGEWTTYDRTGNVYKISQLKRRSKE